MLFASSFIVFILKNAFKLFLILLLMLNKPKPLFSLLIKPFFYLFDLLAHFSARVDLIDEHVKVYHHQKHHHKP